MDRKIVRSDFDSAVEVIREIMTEVGANHTTKASVDGARKIATIWGMEVVPPSILPGITSGKWIPVKKTRDVRVGNLNIAGTVGVTEAEGVANAVFMAGSKGLAEAVIEMFETWSSGGHGKEARAMLKALEDMGCNVDRFRG